MGNTMVIFMVAGVGNGAMEPFGGLDAYMYAMAASKKTICLSTVTITA